MDRIHKLALVHMAMSHLVTGDHFLEKDEFHGSKRSF
jgi:hypothetical protein